MSLRKDTTATIDHEVTMSVSDDPVIVPAMRSSAAAIADRVVAWNHERTW